VYSPCNIYANMMKLVYTCFSVIF